MDRKSYDSNAKSQAIALPVGEEQQSRPMGAPDLITNTQLRKENALELLCWGETKEDICKMVFAKIPRGNHSAVSTLRINAPANPLGQDIGRA